MRGRWGRAVSAPATPQVTRHTSTYKTINEHVARVREGVGVARLGGGWVGEMMNKHITINTTHGWARIHSSGLYYSSREQGTCVVVVVVMEGRVGRSEAVRRRKENDERMNG